MLSLNSPIAGEKAATVLGTRRFSKRRSITSHALDVRSQHGHLILFEMAITGRPRIDLHGTFTAPF